MSRQNNDLLDMFLPAAAERTVALEESLIPSLDELNEKYRPSSELDMGINRMFKRNRNRRALRKTAACIAIIIGISFCLTLSVEASRSAFLDALSNLQREFTALIFGAEEVENLPSSYRIGNLPEGFEQTGMQDDGDLYMVLYQNEDGKTIRFSVVRDDASFSAGTDTEIRDEKIVLVNNTEARLYISEQGKNSIIFVKDGFSFRVIGHLSEEELVAAAKSVRKSTD